MHLDTVFLMDLPYTPTSCPCYHYNELDCMEQRWEIIPMSLNERCVILCCWNVNVTTKDTKVLKAIVLYTTQTHYFMFFCLRRLENYFQSPLPPHGHQKSCSASIFSCQFKHRTIKHFAIEYCQLWQSNSMNCVRSEVSTAVFLRTEVFCDVLLMDGWMGYTHPSVQHHTQKTWILCTNCIELTLHGTWHLKLRLKDVLGIS